VLGQFALDELEDDVVLALPVTVEAALGVAGLLGDVRDGGGEESALLEKQQGRSPSG